MNRHTYLALLAAVAIPFAAIAQEQTSKDPDVQAEELLVKPDAGTAGEQAMEETRPAGDTEQAAKPAELKQDGSQTTLAGANELDGPFVTVPQTGAWRASDLEGKTVMDAKGDNIGDISDVLVNERGEVIAVLVGVGGFLGIGEKDVAVAMNALEFGPGKTEGLKTKEERQRELEARSEAAAQMPADNVDGTGTTGTMGGTDSTAYAQPPVDNEPVVGEDNLPDRIVLNVTREALEAAPAYSDVEAGIDATQTSDVPSAEELFE
ncbi:MAG: PRC-barrel domain-containing protein [Rhizobiaceae bacterium]|nr:PRC-barrel domain-containing protein [Rhizobiaceae bacterium]